MRPAEETHVRAGILKENLNWTRPTLLDVPKVFSVHPVIATPL